MKYTEKEFEGYPDLMTKEQMRIACHISKRTALFLLQSKLIPSVNSGKKTRCYKIKKKDIIEFMNDREVNPHRYIAPENWYHPKANEKPAYTVRIIPDLPSDKVLFKQFYSEKLRDHPDVMSCSDVCSFIGYDRRTVSRWVLTDKCIGFIIKHQVMIPKTKLVDWISSQDFNSIQRKSRRHISLLWEFNEYLKKQ